MAMSDDSMNILIGVKELLSDFGIDVDYNMDHLKEADLILSKFAKHGIGRNNKQKISYARSMVKLAIDAVKLQEKTRKSFPGPKAKVKPGSGAYTHEQVRIALSKGVPFNAAGRRERFFSGPAYRAQYNAIDTKNPERAYPDGYEDMTPAMRYDEDVSTGWIWPVATKEQADAFVEFDKKRKRLSAFEAKLESNRHMPRPSVHADGIKSRRMSDQDSQARYYSQEARFRNVMSSDSRQSLSVGDDDQYALGADTGVHDDFDYLRRIESTHAKMRSRRNFLRNYYNLSGANNPLRTDRDRELFDKTVEFGGGSEGRAMAEEYITSERNDKAESLRRRRRLDAAKREQKANEAYRYDMMDEFDQRMHDLTERYNGDANKADASLRNTLKKELGPFFKNSKMSTKNLHMMTKSIGDISKFPILGSVFKMMLKHPSAALATGAVYASRASLESSQTRLRWQLASGYGGDISQTAQAAAFAVGKNREEAIKSSFSTKSFIAGLKYGEGWDRIAEAAKYGIDPSGFRIGMSYDDFLKYIYNQASNLDEGDRIRSLDLFGVDASEYEKGRLLAGGKMTAEEEVSYTRESWKKRRDENLKKSLYDPRYWEAISTPDWWIDLWSPLGSDGKGGSKIVSNAEYANERAQQDIDYQKSRAVNPPDDNSPTNHNKAVESTNNDSHNKQVSMSVNQVILKDVKDPNDFINKMSAYANGTIDYVMTAVDGDPAMIG